MGPVSFPGSASRLSGKKPTYTLSLLHNRIYVTGFGPGRIAGTGLMFNRVVLVDPDFTLSPERLYIPWEFLLGEQQIGLWIIKQDRDSLGAIGVHG